MDLNVDNEFSQKRTDFRNDICGEDQYRYPFHKAPASP